MVNFNGFMKFSLVIIFVSTHVVHSNVVRWSFGSYIFPMNKSLEFEVTILSPITPGTYSVILFLTGFTGLIPSQMYNDLLTDIATVNNNNAIIVSFDKLGILSPDKEELIFELTLNWTVNNINGLFNSEKTPDIIKNKVFPDNGPNGYTLMSHSAGAHPTCAYLKKQCGKIKKAVWLDPVDYIGFNPFGKKEFCSNSNTYYFYRLR